MGAIRDVTFVRSESNVNIGNEGCHRADSGEGGELRTAEDVSSQGKSGSSPSFWVFVSIASLQFNEKSTIQSIEINLTRWHNRISNKRGKLLCEGRPPRTDLGLRWNATTIFLQCWAQLFCVLHWEDRLVGVAFPGMHKLKCGGSQYAAEIMVAMGYLRSTYVDDPACQHIDSACNSPTPQVIRNTVQFRPSARPKFCVTRFCQVLDGSIRKNLRDEGQKCSIF
jgi:hypothetical protein